MSRIKIETYVTFFAIAWEYLCVIPVTVKLLSIPPSFIFLLRRFCCPTTLTFTSEGSLAFVCIHILTGLRTGLRPVAPSSMCHKKRNVYCRAHTRMWTARSWTDNMELGIRLDAVLSLIRFRHTLPSNHHRTKCLNLNLFKYMGRIWSLVLRPNERV